MHEEIPEIDSKGLRKFGLVTGAIVVLLFGVFFPWLFEKGWPVWPWVIAGLLWLPAVVYPPVLAPLYRGWMKFGMVLGWINSRIILGIFFYLIIFPVGLIMKILRRDPMARKFDHEVGSYRVPSKSRDNEHVKRPF